MVTMKAALGATVLALGAITSLPALAWHHGDASKGHPGGRHTGGSHAGGHYYNAPRARLGVFAAAPIWYYLPPLGYAQAATAPSAPLVYVERSNAQSATELPAGYWYYCAEAQAYYPYVKECAGTWQPVAPLTPQTQ